MPSGKIHAICSMALSPAASMFPVALGFDAWQTAVACGVGCLCGMLITPDLDQEGISSSEYQIIKWTMGLGYVWSMIWYPYARLHKHRGVSHWPIVGTIGRLLYLSIFVTIAIWFGYSIPYPSPAVAGFFFVGLAISDTAHWGLDTAFSENPKTHLLQSRYGKKTENSKKPKEIKTQVVVG